MKFKDWLLEKSKSKDDDFLERFRKLSPDAGSKKTRQYGAGGGLIDPKSPGARKPLSKKELEAMKKAQREKKKK